LTDKQDFIASDLQAQQGIPQQTASCCMKAIKSENVTVPEQLQRIETNLRQAIESAPIKWQSDAPQEFQLSKIKEETMQMLLQLHQAVISKQPEIKLLQSP